MASESVLSAALQEAIRAKAEALCPPNSSGLDIARDELPRIEAVLTDLVLQARAEGSAPQWRSMDSAPKDGTRILGFIKETGEMTAIHWWSPHRSGSKANVQNGGWLLSVPGEYAECADVAPTAWMPLPVQPSQEPRS